MGEIVKITAQQFAAKFEPMQMLQELRNVKGMTDAIKADKNAISFYKNRIGEDVVLAVIEMHLISLGQAINVHEKLSKSQIKEIALEILTLYYFMNMVEIAHVFRKAKRGEFGPIKYAITMPDVLQWFASYSEERINYFMNLSEQESEKLKAEKTIEGGKLVNKLAKKFNTKEIEILKKVKEETPKGFDREDFKKWKKENKI